MVATVATLQFYDTHEAQYTLAYPVLAAEGVAGMCCVIPQDIGGTNFLTQAELLELQNAGWDICYHANAAQELPTLTDAQLFEECNQKRQTLVRMGLQTGARHAMPYKFHAHLREKLALLNAGFVSVYSGDADGKVSPDSTRALWPIVNGHDAIAWNVVTGFIDAFAAAGDRILALGFHGIVAAGAVGLETSVGRLQDVIDYIQTKSLSIVTFSDLLPQPR